MTLSSHPLFDAMSKTYEDPHCYVFFSIHLQLHISLVPNIHFSTLFSKNTVNFYSSHRVRDQVSYQYKTTGKVMILYILIVAVLDTTQKDIHNLIYS
jgi:hypothetical protein